MEQQAQLPQKRFTIGQALARGWETYKKNLGLLILVMLAFAAIHIADGIFGYAVDPVTGQSEGFVAVSLFVVLLNIVMSIGMLTISLALIDSKKASFEMLFLSIKQLKKFFFYILVNILYFLIILGGLILLIVPGIIWALKYQFCFYFVVDKNLGPIEALQASAKITKGFKWDLLGLTAVAAVINFLGLIALVVGLFVTLPVTWLAYAFVFRALCDQGADDALAVTEKTPEMEKEDVLAPVMTAK